jgi:hypothetical protein
MSETTVCVHFDEHGFVKFLVNRPNVRLLVIDERAPNDRVYEMGMADAYVTDEEITKLIGVDRVGRLGDMPVTEAKISALINGDPIPERPALSVVPSWHPREVGPKGE